MRMGDGLHGRYGVATLTQMITTFYADVLNSPRLNHYFDGVHMETLVQHQTAFLSAALGGEVGYTPEYLQQVHDRLRITDDDFTEMMKLLRTTLENFAIDPADTSAVMERYEGTREAIVLGEK